MKFNHSRPVKIVSYGKNKELILDEDSLKNILFQPKALGKKVCIISITGSSHNGKSFLLNFFIRFFKNGDIDNWLDNNDDIFSDSHWKCNSNCSASGIFIWSEAFIINTLQDEKVAVFLIKTQGVFETNSTINDSSALFGLSLMISSMHILNISENIKEDDFQYFKFFANYGKIALQETDSIPFQYLLFLVRDWSNCDHNYGFTGGSHLLSKFFNAQSESDVKFIETKNLIKNCFKIVKCFLMPHPHFKVAKKEVSGKISNLGIYFKKQVVNLVEGIFQDKIFQIKEINGEQITAAEFFEYFKICFSAFQSGKIPSPRALFESTEQAKNISAKIAAKEFYIREMNYVLKSKKLSRSNETFERIHEDTKKKTIEHFCNLKKVSKEDIHENYLLELNNEIDDYKRNFDDNLLNRFISSYPTPTCLFIFMFLNYLIGGILRTFWLGWFSLIFSIGYYISFMLLASWVYLKYCNQNTEYLSYIDLAAIYLWNTIMRPLIALIHEKLIHSQMCNN